MPKKIVNVLKYLFFLGLGVFLVWLSLHKIMSNEKEWSNFKQALKTANYWLIIPVFGMLSLSHLLRALRWKILMQPLGYKPSLPNTFFAVMIGYLANLAVPRLGEVLKCTIIAKYEKVPAEKLVGTIVAERVFDVVCLGIVFLLALIFQFDIVMKAFAGMKGFSPNNPSEQDRPNYILLGIIIALVVLGVFMIATKRYITMIAYIKQILAGVWAGLISAWKLENKWQFIFYSTSIWVLYLLGTYIGFFATQGTTHLGLPAALSALVFASIGMILTPGGIGAYAWLLALVLTLQNPSIPESIGYANGTLQWFAQCLIVLIVGFVCLLLLPWYNKKKLASS